MPYIFTTSMYPSDKADEVVKRYLEAITKYPPDDSLETEIVPVATRTTLQGIKVIRITEVKKGKLEDAMTRTAKMMTMFFNIQGFEYTKERYATLEESMKAMDM
ncbi:MAG: hypothetical protein ABIJ52_09985 [Pseudomonadota bacterium]